MQEKTSIFAGPAITTTASWQEAHNGSKMADKQKHFPVSKSACRAILDSHNKHNAGSSPCLVSSTRQATAATLQQDGSLQCADLADRMSTYQPGAVFKPSNVQNVRLTNTPASSYEKNRSAAVLLMAKQPCRPSGRAQAQQGCGIQACTGARQLQQQHAQKLQIAQVRSRTYSVGCSEGVTGDMWILLAPTYRSDTEAWSQHFLCMKGHAA